MKKAWPASTVFLAVQILAVLGITGSIAHSRHLASERSPKLELSATARLPQPAFDVPDLVSNEQLRAVLLRLQPRFRDKERNVNFIEHALRVWKHDSTFDDPQCLSGAEMVEILTHHPSYSSAYTSETPPLISDTPEKLDLRVAGKNAKFGKSASRHHDHWLACLAESGIGLDHKIQTVRREIYLRDLLVQAIQDFRLDDREYEWSAMIFAYFMPDQKMWTNDMERRMKFDLIAKRLMRANDRLGVCNGTHRLYALALLVQLHQQNQVLSPDLFDRVCARLKSVSNTLVASQEDNGGWNRRWSEGENARDGKDTSTTVDKILVTGHQLEWLSICPQEIQPPRENLVRAGQWLVDAVCESSNETIAEHYTFYSHVVGALSNWRSIRPAQFLSDDLITQ